jgi:hypothetical protein
MHETPQPTLLTHLAALLEADEPITAHARAQDAHVAVSDRRLIVATEDRVTLAIPFEGLRRVQFDIEKNRPATLVLVPEKFENRPQVLAVPPEEYGAIARALAAIGAGLQRAAATTG